MVLCQSSMLISPTGPILVAKALLKYETLDAVEVDRIMKGENLTKPTVGDLLEKEQGRRGVVIQPSGDPKGPDLTLGGGPLPSPG